MSGMGIWLVNGDKPERLRRGRLDLEKELEDWIEASPDLLQPGLIIVGRQFKVSAGVIDLLAVTPDGGWVIVEIKRGKLRRESVGQILDHVSSFETLSSRDLERQVDGYLVPKGASYPDLADRFGWRKHRVRPVELVLVGTRLDPALDDICEYLRNHDVPVSLVTIDVFANDQGERVVMRETHEIVPRNDNSKSMFENVRKQAIAYGVDRELDFLRQAAQRHNLSIRAFSEGVAFTPPGNKRRTLFSVKFLPYQKSIVHLSPQTFSEFYPVSEDEVVEYLGEEGDYEMDLSGINRFISRLDALFEYMLHGD